LRDQSLHRTQTAVRDAAWFACVCAPAGAEETAQASASGGDSADRLAEHEALLPVALNPYALAADDQAVWVTGLGNSTVSRIAYR
jgi:hypothetical protein